MRYNTENCALEISVEELCETVFCHGSLDTAHSPYSPLPAAAEICRRKKAQADARYTPEVALTFTSAFEGIHYEVSGTVDGIICDGKSVAVDFIRCVRGRDMRMPPDDASTAKLICYSYFMCEREGLESVKATFTVFNADTEKSRIAETEYSVGFLRRTFIGYLAKIERRAKIVINHVTALRSTVEDMKFPFSTFRVGQKELIEECYRSIYNGARLFVQAPTGIGKTISTLYPASKALGAGLCDKVFYLTAKASTRREAFGAVRKMHEAGAALKAVIISAKEQMCVNTEAKLSGSRVGKFCNPDKCSLACGYYDRSADAVSDLLDSASGFTPKMISEKAAEYGICPYELSLDLSEHCDIIICDYNYVFDPHVYLKRYFDEKREKYVFLTDETHNLADRARDIYSASVCLRDLETVYARISREDSKINASLEDMMRAMLRLKVLCADNLVKKQDGTESGFYISREPVGALNERLSRFVASCDLWLRRNETHPLYNNMSDTVLIIRNYLGILEYYDEKFRTYIIVEAGNITVRLFCLDPSHILDVCMNRARACVLFSATLTPTDYFADVLGGGKDAVCLSLPSPFKRSHLCLCVAKHISTRFADRDASAGKIAACIAASVLAKKGNYIVYFPSYSYLETVARIFRARYPKVNMFLQTRNMSYADKDRFLDNFRNDTGILRIGFCVLGGSFSEGIDLPGSRLIGSIIVGVGLPQLSNELNIIRDFYETKCERGYEYAYTYPGMNKVLQASGRVIRREDDYGIVVLIDDRYETPQYRALFPEHWSEIRFASSATELANLINIFWQNNNKV